LSKELEILQRRLEREKAARKQAESILEVKAAELYEVNQSLELQVKERTAALEKSEQQYRSIIESADDIIYNIDSNGNFSFVNPAGLNYTGYEEDEVIGKSFLKVIRDDYKEEVQKFYLDVLVNKRDKTYSEFPISTKAGSTLWIGQNVKMIEGENEIISFSVLARDITKRKIAEAELILAQDKLKKSELKYRGIMENMMLGLLEVNNDGVIMKAYPRFCEMVGYEEHELIGKVAEDIFMVHEKDREMIKEKNLSRRENKSDVYETRIKKKDGSIIDVIINGAPFHDQFGNIKGSIGIHYDNTERNRLSREIKKAKLIAEKAQAAEAEFLASMSHEMRTPLNAIVGMSHLLQDAKLNNEESEYLEILSGSANVLQQLISDVLDISKIDAGHLELQHQPFNLNKLLKNLERTFAVKLESKNVFIKTVSNLKLDHLLYGDELILNQIFLNLLGNAEKFTAKGTIIIHVNEIENTRDKVRLELAVSDTGVGMDTKQLDKIFEQFKQASSEIRKEYGGTGLGLAITKKLIQLLGSEIKVESTKDVGTKFYFEIELEKSDILIKQEKKILTQKLEFSEIEHPVLIVEDNAMNQKYITRLLEKWKLKYVLTANGQEAVDACKDQLFSLVFMDIQMPILDGYKATKLIRNSENLNKNTPIIALSASTLLSKKQMALNSGMTDFLSKPYNPTQLSRVILNHLGINETSDAIPEPRNEYTFNSKLDVSYLQDTYADDLEYYLDMMDIFLETVPLEITHLKNAQTSKNFIQFAKTIHKLKPTFTMVGLPDHSKSFEAIELDAKIESNDAFKAFNKIETLIEEDLQIIELEKNKLAAYLKQLN